MKRYVYRLVIINSCVKEITISHNPLSALGYGLILSHPCLGFSQIIKGIVGRYGFEGVCDYSKHLSNEIIGKLAGIEGIWGGGGCY